MGISDWSSDVCSSDLEVGLVSGRKDHGRAAAEEAGDLLLQHAMAGVGAVGDARAGGAGAFAADRCHGGFDAVGIEGQAQVVVGADEDYLVPVDDCLQIGRASFRERVCQYV